MASALVRRREVEGEDSKVCRQGTDKCIQTRKAAPSPNPLLSLVLHLFHHACRQPGIYATGHHDKVPPAFTTCGFRPPLSLSFSFFFPFSSCRVVFFFPSFSAHGGVLFLPHEFHTGLSTIASEGTPRTDMEALVIFPNPQFQKSLAVSLPFFLICLPLPLHLCACLCVCKSVFLLIFFFRRWGLLFVYAREKYIF